MLSSHASRGRSPVAALLLVAFTLIACHPTPRPDLTDTPAETPASWVDGARTTVRVLRWTLPALVLVVPHVIANPATAGRVVAAVEAARTRALPALERALDLYVRERSPTARCEARAAVMAATEALVGIADTTHAAGWGLADEVAQAMRALGTIAAELAPECAPDAALEVSLLQAVHLRTPPALRLWPHDWAERARALGAEVP